MGLQVEGGGEPRAGESWTLTVLVEHPTPQEIEVGLPDFPPELRFEAMRIVPWTGGGLRRSRIEVDLLFLRPGPVRVPSFRVSAGSRIAAVPARDLIVAAGSGAGFSAAGPLSGPPALFWGEGTVSRSGAAGPWPAFEVWLYGRAAPGSGPLPAAGLALDARPLPPPNAIVELLPQESRPPAPEDGGARPLLGIRVIPLETAGAGTGAALRVEPFSFTLGDWKLRSPPLSLAAVPPAGVPAAPARPPAALPVFAADTTPPQAPAAVRLPDIMAGPVLSPALRKILAGAGESLERGQAAEALAMLRQTERGLVFGPRLRPFRRAIETALGFEAPDEPWRPWRLFLAGGVAGVLALLVLILPGRRPGPGKAAKRPEAVTSARPWGYRCIIILLAGLILFCFWGFSARGGGRSALVRAGPAFRAPAPESSALFSFAEGEPIRVRAAAGSWVYAESAAAGSGGPVAGAAPERSGRVGWIPGERVVYY